MQYTPTLTSQIEIQTGKSIKQHTESGLRLLSSFRSNTLTRYERLEIIDSGSCSYCNKCGTSANLSVVIDEEIRNILSLI